MATESTEKGDDSMNILKTLAVLLTIAMLIVSCTSKNLKEESKKAYPNKEWQRPPKHWSPP
jgi:hypothetical protein